MKNQKGNVILDRAREKKDMRNDDLARRTIGTLSSERDPSVK
jgi:hypothetical protein